MVGNMKYRAEDEWQRARAYSVHIQVMNRQHHISLREEFDDHNTEMADRHLILSISQAVYKYDKPDVHIIEICKELELSTDDPISVFEAIVRIADDNMTTPYKVDKILRLIYSGYFYHEDIHVVRNKSDFIKFVKDNLKREPN
ncbi:MAG: hypothetical protein K6E98_07200 [Lachnospiraceae bacterium]|nr:hypothetical protein [Lachnospiraceae bacterium]